MRRRQYTDECTHSSRRRVRNSILITLITLRSRKIDVWFFFFYKTFGILHRFDNRTLRCTKIVSRWCNYGDIIIVYSASVVVGSRRSRLYVLQKDDTANNITFKTLPTIRVCDNNWSRQLFRIPTSVSI